MSNEFVYNFGSAGTITVVTDSSTIEVDGSTGYAVTGITGTINGETITGLFGGGGAISIDSNKALYDNTIFTSSSGAVGASMDGIDGAGIDFIANGSDYRINYLSPPSDAFFLYSDNPSIETQLELVSSNAPCYCAGTRVLTERGETAIEDLRVGDFVVTASGERRPIKWIGHRDISCLAHPDPRKVWPVRIAAGAIAPGLPRRNLYVSPDHSLFFDDVLVIASQIMNGSTVAQVQVEAVSYWHVELDSHDLLVAEGLAAESYLDCANRHKFFNGGAVMSLHPSFAVEDPEATIWSARSLAPRCPDGRLAALRAWLGGRAEYMGARVTTDPGLQVFADGELLPAASVVDRCLRFDIPEQTSRLRLLSRSGVPSQMYRQNSDDGRRLGVNVQKMEIDGCPVALDNPDLSDGWNEMESDASRTWRWTKGDAALPIGRSLALWIDVLPEYPLPWRGSDFENQHTALRA